MIDSGSGRRGGVPALGIFAGAVGLVLALGMVALCFGLYMWSQESVSSAARPRADDRPFSTSSSAGAIAPARLSETPAPAIAPADVAMSSEQRAALAAAKRYLGVMPFSWEGLVKQLEYDKHPTEAAEYAADNVGADWNLQAEKKAQSYQRIFPQSREALVGQLRFDGFTQDEAEYGASKVF